jgi:hypothetical protein
MFESHYYFFLKDLKNNISEIREHKKNAPLILINGTIYIKNIFELT